MWQRLEKRDYKAAFKYLEAHSPFTCPIYGNASSAGFAYKPFAMRGGFYFVYKQLGEILGVAACYNDGNVMVHTASEHADATVIETFDDMPYHSVWGLSGKLPELTEVSRAAGKAFDSRRLDVMVYNGRAESGAYPGLELIRVDRRFMGTSYVSFIKKCLWEGFGFKSSSMDIRKRMKERCELEPYWFLADGKTYVAQAHVQAMTESHGYIGGICTPREFRRKGYAKEIVLRACRFVLSKKRTPALSVSAANKPAYALYASLGFEKIGEMLVYMLEREFKGDENR